MSTVIGLMKRNESVLNFTHKLQAAGFSPDAFKFLTQPREVHALLDKGALDQCHIKRCIAQGAVMGLAFFMPVGLFAALLGCVLLECSLWLWLFGFGGISLIGAGFGAFFGCVFSIERLECKTHLYTEGVGWGNKLVVYQTDNPEIAADSAKIMEQEHLIGVKIFEDDQPQD